MMDAPNFCFAVDLGRHFVRVAIANQKSDEIIILQKFRAIFTLDKDGLPVVGDLKFNQQVERQNIIADATEDHRFGSIVYSKSFCYAQCNDHGQYRISPLDRSDIVQISQQQVIAAFLAKAKSIVESEYNCTDFQKIIVVPTFASDNYRRVILQATQIANYGKKVQLLDQMSAIAISYKYEVAKRIQTTDPDISNHLVAIISVGARSAEFALFLESPWTCQLELLKCAGQANFGSEDLTETLATNFLEEDSLKNCGNPNIPGLMFEKCEKAKENVSMPIQRASIEFAYMDQWGEQHKFRVGLKRKEFDQICEPTFVGIQELIENAFGSHKKQIDRLFFAGDGCRTWKIRELIEDLMAHGHKNLTPNSLEEVTINGAAIYAAVFAKKCAGSSAQQAMSHQFEQYYTPQHVYRCIELQQNYEGQNAQWREILFAPNEKRPTNWREFSYEGNQNITIIDYGGMIICKMNELELEPYSGIKFRLHISGCLQICFYNGKDEHACSAENLFYLQNFLTKKQIEEYKFALASNLSFISIAPIHSIVNKNMGISNGTNMQNNVDKKGKMMNDGPNKFDLVEGTSTKIVENSEDFQKAKDAAPKNTQKTNKDKEEEAKKRTLKNECVAMMGHLESLKFPSNIPPFSLDNMRGILRELMEMCSNREYPYDHILPLANKFRQQAECFAYKHAAVDLATKAETIVCKNRNGLVYRYGCAFPRNFNVEDFYNKFITNVEPQETKEAVFQLYDQFKNDILSKMDYKKNFGDRDTLLTYLNHKF